MNKARLLAPLVLMGMLGTAGVPFAQHNVGHVAAAAVPAKGQGGTIIDGLYEEPDKLIPNVSSMTYAQTVISTLFAPLFYTDNKGALHLGLVAEMPTVANGDISKDGVNWTFKLRPGLKWSDGQPLDARDVDYSWRLWTNKDFIKYSTAGLDQIASTTISADNLSITFHLKKAFSQFLTVWVDYLQPMPQHVFGKLTAKQLNTSKYMFNPEVGSGPFVIQSRKSGDNITEVPNPYYYQAGMPYAGKVIFRIIPDQVAITNALRAHEIDASWFLDVSQYDTLKSIAGYTLVPGLAPNIEQGDLQLKNPILQDVRVRQALEYGVNRQAMVKAVWKGGAVLMAADIPPGMQGFNPALKPYPYDPVKAGQLLDQAGWTMGSDGYRHKNGQTLALRWTTTAHNQWRAQDQLIAQQSYKQIGIKLTLVNYPASTYFGTILPDTTGKAWDIGEFENNFQYGSEATMYVAFQSTQNPPNGGNYGSYSNPAYDKLLAQIEASLDATQQNTLLQQAEVIMHNDVPSLWLYDPPNFYSYSNNLHNYAAGPVSGEAWNSWEWYKS